MQKKALLALLLALTLLLSGCALIVKDEAVDAATAIITWGDKVVTKAEVQEEVNSQLNYMAYIYSMYGYSYDVTDASNIAAAQESAIEGIEQTLVIESKIEELGIALTEEEEAEAMETAQSNMDSELEYIKNYVLTDSELEGEELDAAALAELEAEGVTLETYQENARTSALRTKLREEVIKDVEVTEEELLEEYNSRVDSAKETYENNAASYATAVNNGSTIYYAPEGVRRVKQILTKFTDEDQALIDAADDKLDEANAAVTAAASRVSDAQAILDNEEASEEDKAQAQTDLEAAQAELEEANAAVTTAQAEYDAALAAAYANIDETVDEILAQLAEGADWDTLMAEKTQDPGMQSGTTAEKGYAIAEGMTNFDSAFVNAGMALEKIGDVSDKVPSALYGYYIIKYVADEPVGGIDLEQVRETLTSTLLSTKQNTVYTETLEQWVADAGFKVDLNALNN